MGWETVEVGEIEYDALEISGNLGSKNSIWYSTAAGNVVKVDYENIDLGYGYKLNTLEMVLVSTTYVAPGAPNAPSQPNGITTGKINTEYTYNTSTTDSEGDQIYYWFDWGDGTNSGWTEEGFDSGETATVSHIWRTQGSYNIRVRAKDSEGLQSSWSDPLSITMPKNKAKNLPFLGFMENHPRMFPILRHSLELFLFSLH